MKDKRMDVVLDAEEQAMLASVERGEWKTVDNFDQEKTFVEAAASIYLQKDARINIRISSYDLRQLKQRAAFKGLPYQTLIASVLHEYAAGHFEEKL